MIAAGDAEPQKAQRMQWRTKWQHVVVYRASEYIRQSQIEDEEKLGKGAESWLRKWEEGMGRRIEEVESGAGIAARVSEIPREGGAGGGGDGKGEGKEGRDWNEDFEWWSKGRRGSGLDPRRR